MELNTSNALGGVYVSSNVIAEIAGAAATSCYGVVGMAAQNMKGGFTGLIKSDIKRGINVTLRDEAVIIDLHIIIRYGVNINTVCKSIVNRVRYAIETGIGLSVSRINVRVEGVKQN